MAASEVSPSPSEWIRLNEGKQFSRLLYTNPVCFLASTDPSDASQLNVMVLSWLTATNNKGEFMLSLNKRRHTASLLREGCCIGLSVPVKGMENLVLATGRASGRFGSKFGQGDKKEGQRLMTNTGATTMTSSNPPLSKRQKKKQNQRSPFVQGLKPVPIGHQLQQQQQQQQQYFAVDGTVAHLKCQLLSINDSGVIDAEHLLIVGEIVDAFVHRDYWDEEKNLFRPRCRSVPPYLTFFGSQTFGYVTWKSLDS